MDFFVLALLSSLVLTVPVTLIALIGNEHREGTLLAGAYSLLGLLLLNWAIFWFSRPTTGFSAISFYKSWWIWMLEAAVVIAAVLVASGNLFSHGDKHPSRGSYIVTGVWALIFVVGWVTMGGGVWSQNRASQLANTVDVEIMDAGEYPETDTDHILMVPVEVARQTAGTALSSGGNARNFGTLYQLGEPNLQLIDGSLYWIVPMLPKGFMEYNQVSGAAPGYVVVDAEDPQAPARMQTTDVDDNELSLHFNLDGMFSTNLQRHVWSKGYADAALTDWTIEVDDSWRPFWTASVDQLTLNFKNSVPASLIVVDAQTGDIKEHELNAVPDWVDRIYSSSTVLTTLDWWGNYGNPAEAPYKFFGMFRSQGGRFATAENQQPSLVYTEGGNASWQVQITPLNGGESVSYVAMFDTRGNNAKLYQIDNLSTETRLTDTIREANWNAKKNQPSHLSMHSIYGVLTWVAPLINPVDGDDDDSNSTFQGIALLPASSSDGASAIHAATPDEALSQYRAKVVFATASAVPEEGSVLTTVQGFVTRVSNPLVEAGSTVYYFLIDTDASSVYRVAVDPMSETSNVEIPFIREGSNVSVTFSDNGSPTRYVLGYDDLSLQLGMSG